MNISITPDGQVTHNGEEIARIIDGECLSLEKLGGVTKGAIRKTSGLENLPFKIVQEFPLHGDTREAGTGSVMPLETRVEKPREVLSISPPTAPLSKVVDGIKYVQVESQAYTGWITTGVMGVLKLPE